MSFEPGPATNVISERGLTIWHGGEWKARLALIFTQIHFVGLVAGLGTSILTHILK